MKPKRLSLKIGAIALPLLLLISATSCSDSEDSSTGESKEKTSANQSQEKTPIVELKDFDLMAQIKSQSQSSMSSPRSNEGNPSNTKLCVLDVTRVFEAHAPKPNIDTYKVWSEKYGEITLTRTRLDFVSIAENFGLKSENFELNYLPKDENAALKTLQVALETFANLVPDRITNWSGQSVRLRSFDSESCSITFEKFDWPKNLASSFSEADQKKYGNEVLRPGSQAEVQFDDMQGN